MSKVPLEPGELNKKASEEDSCTSILGQNWVGPVHSEAAGRGQRAHIYRCPESKSPWPF